MRAVRLAYLVTHPIQYQAPLLRRIAAEPDIDLTVLFEDDFSLSAHVDRDFGRAIAWDVRLLDGYRHRFLDRTKPHEPDKPPSFWWPRSRNLGAALREGRFDALWVHGYSHADHLKALAIGRRLGLRTLLRDETSGTSRHRSRPRMLAKRALFFGIDRLVDHYLTVGTANAQHYLRLGIAPEKLICMPYAVDSRKFDRDAAMTDVAATRRQHGATQDQHLILFSAKLIPRKRPMDLLQAIARLDPQPAIGRPVLIFAGDGALMPLMRQAAQSLGLDNVHFLGFQTQAELAALYAASDVMVLPSEWESWGLVVNEAMNGGCAIVASDRVGAAPDLVRDNGFVFPVGDVPALTRALGATLEDRGRLEHMQRRSREIAAEWSFDSDVAALRRALGMPARTSTS